MENKSDDHALYADIIVDIQSDNLDRPFQYRIPGELKDRVGIGTRVCIPFGRSNRSISGYVINISGNSEFDKDKIKSIIDLEQGAVTVEGHLIQLAAWMRREYGSTMIQALKTVLPMKQEIRAKKKKKIYALQPGEELESTLAGLEKKHQTARARLVRELLENRELDYTEATGRLRLNAQVISFLEREGIIAVEEEQVYRLPDLPAFSKERSLLPALSSEQAFISNEILAEAAADRRPCLLHGITGSGKTRVYIQLIREMIRMKKQVIVLIPEIALTYQLIWQFRQCFGDQAALIHSRMSQGERWDAFEAARQGKISVMVGPRSALFTPFPELGMVIIDEEHESSYKSEGAPRYHARETAEYRCSLQSAQLVLGSATPSLEAYRRCEIGEYRLFTMTRRFGNGRLPKISIIDMREELRQGNTSIISEQLRQGIEDRLKRGEQTLLFLNRRGYAGFVSCRNCGYVVKCPHCDVALSEHKSPGGGSTLICHYCGFSRSSLHTCPECASRFIGGFRAGTQQVEEQIRQMFPEARVGRMDLDTTKRKNDHSKILTAVSRQEIDILIGTQMIVKGHDFPKITLVGVLAADLSLFSQDYRSAERTFQLLVQAVGRAGRGADLGEAVIQTYHPEHYSILRAADQDYKKFYEEEMAYRIFMDYPPSARMLAIMGDGEDKEQLSLAMEFIKKYIEKINHEEGLQLIGPAEAAIGKLQDRYRQVIYMKHRKKEYLSQLQNETERYVKINSGFNKLNIQYEFY